jgi:putative FmdB family regulatory protein
MPIFEYRCRKCEKRFERIVRRIDEEIACPSCEGRSVDKLLSAFAVGSGRKSIPMESCASGACAPTDCCRSGGCGFAD